MNVPRLVIAGTHSGSGKTTLTIGLVAALSRRGLKVQPFKCGPDYIDPGYLSAASGFPCRNLDTWMVPQANTLELFCRAAQTSDVSIIEGVMGLFDGRGGADLEGSTAEIAFLLKAPVILVIDVGKMSGSAAAVALGYKQLHPEINLAGVIANNVGSPRHLRWVTEAIEKRAGIPVLGHLPKNAEISLPERHLGLVPSQEQKGGEAFLETLVTQMEETVDLDACWALARQAPEVKDPEATGLFPPTPLSPQTTLAVAQDEAFSFYYQDNLDLLRAWGAKLLFVSPLRDEELPEEAQGVYLGGGFPEVFAKELSANQSFMESLRQAVQAGLPLYAECGGLMYLCEGIVDFEEEFYPLIGLVPGRARMQKRLSRMGYATGEALHDSLLARQGQQVRGHIFHWSSLPEPTSEAAYRICEREGQHEGFLLGPEKKSLASYLHVHFGSDPSLAERFVASCSP